METNISKISKGKKKLPLKQILKNMDIETRAEIIHGSLSLQL